MSVGQHAGHDPLRHGSADAADRVTIERGAKRTVISLPRHGVAMLTLALTLVVGWSIVAAAYMAFHDTVVAKLRHDAKAAAKGYDAQIAAMRAELERNRTRRLVEKAGVHERVAELGQRQAVIERRQARLAELAQVRADVGAPAPDVSLSYSMKPRPFDQPSDSLEPSGSPRASALQATDKVAASLDAVEADQTRAIEGLRSQATERRRTLERVYDAARVPRPGLGGGRARGGPFEPVPAKALTFEAQVEEVLAERGVVAAFEKGLDRVPLRTPAAGSAITSGFGARTDPFLGRLAFHSGLDFEGDLNEPVKATAAGRVVSAGWSGGYGNMVEIEHGGGVTTRFGHLSAIEVSPGDPVRIGTPIGRVGSTGRSTGPHIHYETRVNGEAVDPLRFLNAGRILAAARR